VTRLPHPGGAGFLMICPRCFRHKSKQTGSSYTVKVLVSLPTSLIGLSLCSSQACPSHLPLRFRKPTRRLASIPPRCSIAHRVRDLTKQGPRTPVARITLRWARQAISTSIAGSPGADRLLPIRAQRLAQACVRDTPKSVKPVDIAIGSRSASIASRRSTGASSKKRRSLRMLDTGGYEQSTRQPLAGSVVRLSEL
jgi:hypothetical protein